MCAGPGSEHRVVGFVRPDLALRIAPALDANVLAITGNGFYSIGVGKYSTMHVSNFLVWFKVQRLLQVDHTSPIDEALDEIQWWNEETVIKDGPNLVEQ
jgi:hypothetical protein